MVKIDEYNLALIAVFNTFTFLGHPVINFVVSDKPNAYDFPFIEKTRKSCVVVLQPKVVTTD